MKDTATTGGHLVAPAAVGSGTTRLVWWQGHRLVCESAVSVYKQPLIADSWLVVDGSVRGLQMHEQRFCDACARLLPELTESTVKDFLGCVRTVLPLKGRWFPRVEAHATQAPQLALWLRPAPGRAKRTTLWVAPESDPRSNPQVKGPDLKVLAELRERACLAGADDALLCTGDGSVLETAHSSLVWWRDERLYLPAAELPTLPSVTRALVVGLAERRGVTVAFEHIQAHEVSALDAWTLNALHGIRPVSGWLGSTGSRHARSSVGSRPEEWSVALDELMVPVDDIPFE